MFARSAVAFAVSCCFVAVCSTSVSSIDNVFQNVAKFGAEFAEDALGLALNDDPAEKMTTVSNLKNSTNRGFLFFSNDSLGNVSLF